MNIPPYRQLTGLSIKRKTRRKTKFPTGSTHPRFIRRAGESVYSPGRRSPLSFMRTVPERVLASFVRKDRHARGLGIRFSPGKDFLGVAFWNSEQLRQRFSAKPRKCTPARSAASELSILSYTCASQAAAFLVYTRGTLLSMPTHSHTLLSLATCHTLS